MVRACLWLAVFAGTSPLKVSADSADQPRTLLCERGKVLMKGAFNQGIPPGWTKNKGKWETVNGALRGQELASDMHGGVLRHPLAFRDAVIQFSFQLDGAKITTFSINHAQGHICRVKITPDGFSVIKDGNKKTNEKSIVLDTCETPIAPGQWHTMVLELRGKEMLAQLDGKFFAVGAHDALAQPKANVGFTVLGQSVLFKDLTIWEGTPNPAWAETKAKLVQGKNK